MHDFLKQVKQIIFGYSAIILILKICETLLSQIIANIFSPTLLAKNHFILLPVSFDLSILFRKPNFSFFLFLYLSNKTFLSHLLLFDFQDEKLQENEGDS
jgi:hypothetical protein